MVIGVNWLLGAHCAAQDLNGAVRDDLVSVHVGLGARAGLPNDEGKVVDEFEGGDFFSRLLDGLSELGVYESSAWSEASVSRWRTQAIFHVDRGRGAFEDAKGSHNRWRHAVLWLIDAEIAQRAFCLGTPVPVGGDLDLAKGIALGSGGGHGGGGGGGEVADGGKAAVCLDGRVSGELAVDSIYCGEKAGISEYEGGAGSGVGMCQW